MKKKTFCNSY